MSAAGSKASAATVSSSPPQCRDGAAQFTHRSGTNAHGTPPAWRLPRSIKRDRGARSFGINTVYRLTDRLAQEKAGEPSTGAALRQLVAAMDLSATGLEEIAQLAFFAEVEELIFQTSFGTQVAGEAHRKMAHVDPVTAAEPVPMALNPIDVMTTEQAATVDAAKAVLAAVLMRSSATNIGAPHVGKDLAYTRLAGRGHECFAVMFLDAQHRLIAFDEMFHGTLTQASVYPREVARRALAHNAAAVTLAHNHPSGVPEPSRADELLTQVICKTLSHFDIRVLDHYVVGASSVVSFAERGLL
jgi:DNA repair protein RadC